MSDKTIISQWLLELHYPPGFTDLGLDTDYYYWTGKGELTINSNTYVSTNDLISIEGVEARLSEAAARPRVTFSGVDANLRTLLLHDPGRVDVVIGAVRWDGAKWVRLPRQVRGLLTDPVMQGHLYTFEVTPQTLDVDRGEVEYWTDEDHRRRYPNDGVFQHSRTLSDGVDIAWPP